jgi:glycosyltransferase involved in cell wall biosynthesis
VKALLTGMDWFPHRPGGLNRYFQGMVEALPRVGVRGTAVVSHVSEEERRPCSRIGMDLVPMAAQGASLMTRLKGAHRAVLHTVREGLDVVNSHFAMYAFPWVRSLPPDLPLVVNFQGPWAEEIATEATGLRARVKPIAARALELMVYRRATRLITLSRAFAQILEERYSIRPERICVVPGALDLKPYLDAPDRIEARRRLGWPTDRPILLTVRRLVRRMGLELLLDAMKEIRRHHPDVLLMIGGNGPLSDELSRRIQELGLADHVKLLGLIPESELPTAYAAADLSVVPTVKLEGFGLVTVESLGAGTPVLGTPVGATPEILTDLEPNLIFDAASPSAIAHRVTAALRGDMRIPSRAQCRAYAARYDWQNVAPRIKEVYEHAIRDCRSKSAQFSAAGPHRASRLVSSYAPDSH